MTVSYRWLNGIDATEEEWSKIEEVLVARGWCSLSHPTTRIRIAEDESGQLCGFLVLQLFPHTEPLWVAKECRGTGIAEQLASDMVDFLIEVRARGWEVTADTPEAAKLAEKHGMVREVRPVYRTK